MGHDGSIDGTFHLGVYAAHLVRVVERWNVSAEELLAGTGLHREALEDPRTRIPDEAMHLLATRALALTREPALGFHVGRAISITAHGSVGLAVMTSRTLGDAFAVATRYFPLRSGHVELDYRIDGEFGIVELVPRANLEGIEVFEIESLYSGLGHILELLLERPFQCTLDVRYPEPKHFRGYAHLFPGPARFRRPSNRIIFPLNQLDAPIRLADDFASREAIARCEAELASLGETSTLLGSIRKQLRNRDRGFLSLTELAELRGVSPRTLKRRLEEHGTSFQLLLDDLRRDRAIHLLENDARTVEEVASDLGYADVANFRRAFKRWMGVPPQEWRAAARRSEGREASESLATGRRSDLS